MQKKFFLPAGVVRIANDDKALEITASEIIPLEELDGDAAKKLLETATQAASSATDAVAKAQHTITMRVANAIVKATEKYKV
jgi:F0F1-type ATP synthase epsilon subunit